MPSKHEEKVEALGIMIQLHASMLAQYVVQAQAIAGAPKQTF